jgi:hypothetical protein
MGLVLLGALIIGVRVPRHVIHEPSVLAILTAFGFPLAWLALSGANLYDGLRHLFFLQPLLALGAASGIVGVTNRISRRARLGFLAAVGLATVITIGDSVRLHPFEHVYFNRISGGLPAAAGRYELDYWGLSYREGAEWLNENLLVTKEISVAACSRPESTSHFLAEGFLFLGSLAYGASGSPDYLLYTAPHDCGDQEVSGEVVYQVTRDGVALLTIVRPVPGPGG